MAELKFNFETASEAWVNGVAYLVPAGTYTGDQLWAYLGSAAPSYRDIVPKPSGYVQFVKESTWGTPVGVSPFMQARDAASVDALLREMGIRVQP